MTEHIEQDLRKFVIDNFLFGECENEFSNEDSFLEKGIVDSLGILTLVAFVHQRYAISVPDEELVPENWDSVKRIVGYVQNKLSVMK